MAKTRKTVCFFLLSPSREEEEGQNLITFGEEERVFVLGHCIFSTVSCCATFSLSFFPSLSRL